jgi:hypothetical protein
MRSWLALVSLVLAGLLSASQAHAVTQLTALTRSCFGISLPLCDFAPLDSGPGAESSIDRVRNYTSAGSPFATHASLVVPDWDSFAAEVSASGDYADPFGTFGISETARTTARYRDTITATGGSGAGRLHMVWHIEGSNAISWQAGVEVTSVTASVSLDFLCFGGPTQPCFSPHRRWTTDGAVDELIAVDIPITFGVPSETFLEIDLRADLGFTATTCNGTCLVNFRGSVNGSFGSTGTLVDVQLFDLAGNEYDPSNIQAESGFRYDLVGVPEPSALALAPMLLAVAGSARRARARR